MRLTLRSTTSVYLMPLMIFSLITFLLTSLGEGAEFSGGKQGIKLQKPLTQLRSINQLNHLLQVTRMHLMRLMGKLK